MEYVDSEDLASLLRRIGRIPQDKADVERTTQNSELKTERLTPAAPPSTMLSGTATNV